MNKNITLKYFHCQICIEQINITNLSAADIDYESIQADDDSLNQLTIDCSIVRETVLPS